MSLTRFKRDSLKDKLEEDKKESNLAGTEPAKKSKRSPKLKGRK